MPPGPAARASISGSRRASPSHPLSLTHSLLAIFYYAHFGARALSRFLSTRRASLHRVCIYLRVYGGASRARY